MCELFALSARTPTTVSLSLETFAEHGGGSGPHADGWGIAYHDGRDAMIVRDVRPAADNPWLPAITDTAPPMSLVIAHIRKATQGAVTLANTQPFRRELGGRVHVFAHNGDLTGVEVAADAPFQPVGDTDSERAFCLLMTAMADVWTERGTVPPLAERAAVFADFCADMRTRGPANFLYTDGVSLFAHANERTQADGVRRPPGLHVLCRTCSVDTDGVSMGGISLDGEGQSVQLFASVPLSDEAWRPLDEGEIVIAEDGAVVSP